VKEREPILISELDQETTKEKLSPEKSVFAWAEIPLGGGGRLAKERGRDNACSRKSLAKARERTRGKENRMTILAFLFANLRVK